jgi:hypothetical protein
MAEPSDRPAAAAGRAEPYPGLGVAPEVSPPAGEAAYRSLSIPAVIGCALAVVYAAFLVVCGAASFATGMPLYLAGYTLLVPLVAVLLSALGWLQVQRSEGTRAGAGLAVWGMVLGGLFGLGYWAYLEGSRAAVGAQAQVFADQWIDLVRQGQLDEAFRLTIPPDQRPQPGAELRRNLELRFNNADKGGRVGPFTMFRENDAVLLLNHGRTAQAGQDTTVRALGLKNWEYRGGAYHVYLQYELESPERKLDLQVAVEGTDSRQEGRQWAINLKEAQPRPPGEQTPLGERVMVLKMSSSDFMQNWVHQLGEGKWDQAYLETLEPSRRRPFQAVGAARLVAAGLVPGAGRAVDTVLAHALLPGYRDFRQGGILRAGETTFWAEGRSRQAIPADLRSVFATAPQVLAASIRPNNVSMPIWDREGDRVRFYHDFQLLVFPRYMVQGTFVVETDAAVLDNAEANPVWRVAAIDLSSGRGGHQGMPRP